LLKGFLYDLDLMFQRNRILNPDKGTIIIAAREEALPLVYLDGQLLNQ